MAEMDQEFVEYIVKALVAKPEAVDVKRTVDDEGVLLELTVDKDDVGKVIGRAGATAKSIRKLLGVLSAKQDQRVSLKIIEPAGSREEKEAKAEATKTEDQAEPAVEAKPEEAETSEKTEAEQPVEESKEAEPEEEADSHSKVKKEIEELADLDL